jgi:hypothetical protein
MFALRPFSFLSQSHEKQLHEVQACALWDATYYDTMRLIIPEDDVDIEWP